MNLDRRFPCIAEMEKAARRRIPKIAWDYLAGGIGLEAGLARNRRMLDEVVLTPRYLGDWEGAPDLTTRLLGRDWSAPFGVAPVGLGGMIWPRSAEHLVRAARDANIPFALSTVANATIEEIGRLAPGHPWFQLYAMKDREMNRHVLGRARAAGYDTLVITVDVPKKMRRDRDMRNGLGWAPGWDVGLALDIARRPAWAWQMALHGMPRFNNLTDYLPKGLGVEEIGRELGRLRDGRITAAKLGQYREDWQGKLVIKGILSPEEAVICRDVGADAVVVSNHGGRQIDAARSAVEVLPAIRSAVGPDFPLIADGGARNGLDIMRMLACGANFVLLGRAFYFAMAAMGAPGAAHAIHVLKEELAITMGQLGARRPEELPGFLG
ncbi:alpha-hydroxy-acid oxidizing protein [Limibaculum sp. FT325]|uniref:alpha-hydroxy acid oxidase n=1 Tax=Thermohalobaculum sediminis TaxID=2939436 RepID=UPI0020BF0A6B|nr:alpha-hydroxy acid oxidase [Limibaculum sediminis]MCL5778174.1 alpha-hydroxy-acid oxidizing protein [Limibaculum sediminis]